MKRVHPVRRAVYLTLSLSLLTGHFGCAARESFTDGESNTQWINPFQRLTCYTGPIPGWTARAESSRSAEDNQGLAVVVAEFEYREERRDKQSEAAVLYEPTWTGVYGAPAATTLSLPALSDENLKKMRESPLALLRFSKGQARILLPKNENDRIHETRFHARSLSRGSFTASPSESLKPDLWFHVRESNARKGERPEQLVSRVSVMPPGTEQARHVLQFVACSHRKQDRPTLVNGQAGKTAQSGKASGSPASSQDALQGNRAARLIAVISDLNSAYGSTTYRPSVARAIQAIVAVKPDLVITSGDLIAGQDQSLSEAQILAMWNAFDRVVYQPLRGAGIPFAPGLGNHDASIEFSKDRSVASRFWNERKATLGVNLLSHADFPFNYTFGLDNIYFMAWDAMTAYTPWRALEPGQPLHLNALEQTSAFQNAALRIVVGHLPLFAVGSPRRNTAGNVIDAGKNMEISLRQAGFHLYVSGHHHVYYPAHVPGGMDLLNMGLLGEGPRQILGTDLTARTSMTFIMIPPDRQKYAYLTFDVDDLTEASREGIERAVFGLDGFPESITDFTQSTISLRACRHQTKWNGLATCSP